MMHRNLLSSNACSKEGDLIPLYYILGIHGIKQTVFKCCSLFSFPKLLFPTYTEKEECLKQKKRKCSLNLSKYACIVVICDTLFASFFYAS